MNVYIKQQQARPYAALPLLNYVELHCTCALSLYVAVQCHIKTSPHTMCAPVTPLEEGIFGVGQLAGLEPNTSVLPVSRKKARSRILFFG